MTAFVSLVLVAAVAGASVLTILGFQPAKPLSQFKADRRTSPRSFADSVERVQQEYAKAALRTSGMRVIENVPGTLYIDSRPTARIIGGDFGVAVKVDFVPDEHGTVVVVAAQAKTWGSVRSGTLAELERSLRMRAKGAGLTEVIA